jgi:hypothetical protein
MNTMYETMATTEGEQPMSWPSQALMKDVFGAGPKGTMRSLGFMCNSTPRMPYRKETQRSAALMSVDSMHHPSTSLKSEDDANQTPLQMNLKIKTPMVLRCGRIKKKYRVLVVDANCLFWHRS